MGSKVLRALLFLLGWLSAGRAAGDGVWADPPFLAGPSRDDVFFEEYIEGKGQVIFMNEEIKGPVAIAKVNYAGASVPVIVSVQDGSARNLGAKIQQLTDDLEKEDSSWHLVITEKQDFEITSMQKYRITIQVEDGTKTFESNVFLNILNIDDVPPIITGGTCEVPELYLGVTNCTYLVTDEDGQISKSAMTFKIIGRENEDNIFKIIEDRSSDSVYEMSITLEVVLELLFVESQLHLFTIEATDSGRNTGKAAAVVQVKDVPNMPPVWKTIFATQRFDEQTEQSFVVAAVDGDTQINIPIEYRLYKATNYTFLDIDKMTGVLTVDKIDRDFLQKEVFTFDISAYKANNHSWEAVFEAVIIVDDINNKVPTVSQSNFELEIDEETYMSLAFNPGIFIEDKDLADNAQYSVELVSISPAEAAQAFLVIPEQGYQKQEFQITIVNSSMLDYDIPMWQVVKFQIKATEMKNPKEHIGMATITINLRNWNDEEPIFDRETYTANFTENVKAGYKVVTVHATDRDIGDHVIYSLVGSVTDYLSINKTTGDITVKVDNAFNYHSQKEIVVQVKAEDILGEPFHITFTQLIIYLEDANNRPPQITMPKNTPMTEENVKPYVDILKEDKIVGQDVDTTAKVVFSIDWDSSYANKQGRRVLETSYRRCVDIKTEYPDANRLGYAHGTLVTQKDVIIDFEEFEVLYLNIKLTDINQKSGINSTEGTLTVIIEDLNDNQPQWAPGSLETARFVREVAKKDIVIGFVLANDIDGPLFNNVTYFLREDGDTPMGLVSVGRVSGQLQVLANEAIDADTDKRQKLIYVLTATDCLENAPDMICWNTTGKVEIQIIDTNNKNPIALIDEYPTVIKIPENAKTSTPIVTIKSSDADRDDIYNNVTYTVNFKDHPNLTNFFDVNLISGLVYVNLQNNHELDRDHGVEKHEIFMILRDNYRQEGDRNFNTASISVTVVLEDVNDNAPELPEKFSWLISENTDEESELLPELKAPDIDEPNTDNSRVNYELLLVTSLNNPATLPVDFFYFFNHNNITGILKNSKPLVGHWGSYDLWTRAFDLGEHPMSSNKTYRLTVTPYNYDVPIFHFPLDGQLLRLAKERTVVNGALFYPNGTRLDLVKAKDCDGLEAGEVTFEIIGSEEAKKYFVIEEAVNNQAMLTLQREIDDAHLSFQMTIKAKDKGTDPKSFDNNVTFYLEFVDTEGDPYFVNGTENVNFTELVQDKHQLQSAYDPKGMACGDNCKSIYYYIIDGETKDLFDLNKETNLLSVVNPEGLNRTQAVQHALRVLASNQPSPPAGFPSSSSILSVYIEVKELDPRPRFESYLYTGGIAITDINGRIILHVKATHSEKLPIKYTIVNDTMKADPSLESVKDEAFLLDDVTGELKLNFKQQGSMTGMFEFNISALDTVGKLDTAEVIIFLIADDKRVSFIFQNNIIELENQTLFVAETFKIAFGYLCNVDYITKANNPEGVALDDQTEVKTHFIDNDLAIDAAIIENKKNDIKLMRSLREDLRSKNLILEDFTSNAVNGNVDSMEKMLQIVLIVVSTVLGTLCAVLLIAFCLRTRSLNRRLNALSTTKFGSQNSGLNRVGVAVPGTNKHALEGSNPVWNEEIRAPQFDTISNASGDSDLIGVEDQPQFAYDNPQFGKSTEKEVPKLRNTKVSDMSDL